MKETRPLKGQSILIIADDRLAAFRLHKHLVAAGARVATGDRAAAEPYLRAAALAAVVITTDLNAADAATLMPRLAECPAPWVAYGRNIAWINSAAACVNNADALVEALAMLCGSPRQQA